MLEEERRVTFGQSIGTNLKSLLGGRLLNLHDIESTLGGYI